MGEGGEEWVEERMYMLGVSGLGLGGEVKLMICHDVL